jgi:hypothetical protein
MSTQYETRPDEEHVSGWALGAIAFAATIMTMLGVFQVIIGLVAIFNDEFFVVTNYPIWALVVIGLDIWLIWALTRPGAITTT